MKRLLTLLVLTLLATALAAPPMGLEQKVVPTANRFRSANRSS